MTFFVATPASDNASLAQLSPQSQRLARVRDARFTDPAGVEARPSRTIAARPLIDLPLCWHLRQMMAPASECWQ